MAATMRFGMGRTTIRRGAGKRRVDGKSLRLADEVRYIQRSAADHDGRVRPTPSWPRRKSAASRPKNNSSATLKSARSRANRRHHYRTNLIPRRQRNFTDPYSRIMKSKEGFV